jgi:hypothetical protein
MKISVIGNEIVIRKGCVTGPVGALLENQVRLDTRWVGTNEILDQQLLELRTRARQRSWRLEIRKIEEQLHSSQ